MGFGLAVFVMSVPISIHQLYHGYRHGHEQIAASIELSQPDSDEITRLSDLSGTPLSGFAFESYLSMYPLPSLRFFALAMTRPDRSTPRAGCVLTHTLLCAMEDWSMLPAPKEISSLFFKTASVPDEVSTLEHTPKVSLEHSPTGSVSLEDRDFVGRYFGEGIRPIIWFDVSDADTKLWAIVDGLWPALRRSFSACTLCLQPRSTHGRMFDLMFAPRTVSSRFSRFSADHFVDPSPTQRVPWENDFATQLFAGGIVDPDTELLTASLDDNPSSIGKIFLFRELWKRSWDKPTAAIGVFDLLQSVNPSEAISHLQNSALNRSVSSFNTLSSDERLELFYMLLLRISRLRIESHRQQAFFEDLVASVMGDILDKFPQEVLAAIERVWLDLPNDAGLKATLMNELAAALPDNLFLSMAVAHYPDIGKELLAETTPAFSKALSLPGAELLREQTIEWLNETPFREQLPKFRVSLLSHLKADQDLGLFRKALTDIRKDEVVTILNLLVKHDALSYRNHSVREAIIDSIARPYPALTRDWVNSSNHRDEVLAEIVSVTYLPDAIAYREILSGPESDPGFRRLVLSNWVVRNSVNNSRFVGEITDLASHDPNILDLLIEPNCEEVSAKALQIVVESLGSVSPLPGSLLKKVLLYQSGNLRLIDLATRSVITDYVRSGANATVFETALEENRCVEWLASSSQNWRLPGLIRAAISGPESCSRAWEVLYKLPDAGFRQNLLIGSIESLLAVTVQFWSVSTLETWVKIIRRARYAADDGDKFEVDLCGLAVRFAFENAHLPTSGLVVEGFLPLYRSITGSKYVPRTAEPLFSFWNWDKGRELRETLVDKFMSGKWPPGDLGLAVNDFGLLRKILSRMSRRSGGRSFARKVYSDLVSRDDDQSRSLADDLASLLRDPYYQEEWD